MSDVKHYTLRLFLAAAFVLTLSLKLLLNQREAPDPALFGATVASFLIQHGFDSRLEKRFGHFFVHANAGKCRVLVSEVVPEGWDRSTMELLAKPVGRLSYVFDGSVYEHEPFLAPLLDEYWKRLRTKIGLSPTSHPVLAVAASDDCAIEALPWWDLGMPS